MEVLVVGSGIMGLCTAQALTTSGYEVRVVSPAAANAASMRASADHHRLIRIAYGAMPGYMEMARGSFDAWDRLFAALNERLYVETGTLVLGRPDSPWVSASLQHLQSTDYDVLTPGEIDKVVPGLKSRTGDAAFLVPRGGVLLAQRILDGLERILASVRIEGEVVRIEAETGTVWLRSGEALSAEHVVLALGAWPWPQGSPPARREACRQTALYLQPPDGLGRGGPFVLDLSRDGGFYFVPGVAGTPAKVGTHEFGPAVPVNQSRECTASEIAALESIRRGRAGFTREWPVAGYRACYYDVTPDERFLAPRRHRCTWLGGFSGHGFKFAPLIAERLVGVLDGHERHESFQTWLAGGT